MPERTVGLDDSCGGTGHREASCFTRSQRLEYAVESTRLNEEQRFVRQWRIAFASRLFRLGCFLGGLCQDDEVKWSSALRNQRAERA